MIELADWNKPYINKGVWIFENLQDLNLEPAEALLIFVINYFNETHQPVDYDLLVEKCHMSPEELDETIENLSAKGYLSFDTSGRSLGFVLEGLLDLPAASGKPVNQSLISEFQQEFQGRTLSSSDMDKIIELSERYDERMILAALSEAAVYDKRSIPYVESVLANWSMKGLSAEDVENGKR